VVHAVMLQAVGVQQGPAAPVVASSMLASGTNCVLHRMQDVLLHNMLINRGLPPRPPPSP